MSTHNTKRVNSLTVRLTMATYMTGHALGLWLNFSLLELEMDPDEHSEFLGMISSFELWRGREKTTENVNCVCSVDIVPATHITSLNVSLDCQLHFRDKMFT